MNPSAIIEVNRTEGHENDGLRLGGQARELRQDKTRRVRDGRLDDEACLFKELAQCAMIIKRLRTLLRIGNKWLYATLQEILP
jgi:hypothetical protein